MDSSRLLVLTLFVFLVASTIAGQSLATPPAVTFTTLANLGEAGDGEYPNAPLVQGTDGNFYGTTLYGGTGRHGTVYNVSPQGTVTVVEGQGDNSYASLIQATDGSFYGTNSKGGAHGGASTGGSIFKVTSSGTLTAFYSFCTERHCNDGSTPYSPVIQAMDGNFYGTTITGGSGGSCLYGCGVVYKITPAGNFSTLYDFCTQTGCPDGASPFAGIVQGTDGNFYGVTASGGTNGWGTIFKITATGTLTTLYNFPLGVQGGPLIQGNDGSFYGPAGAASNGNATIFKITSSGKYSTVHTFCLLTNCTDGVGSSQLVQGTDGNFYGTSATGGTGAKCYNSSYGCGTAWMLTPQGVLTTLYNFCPAGGKTCPDGQYPRALVQGTDGSFYGVTNQGGTRGYGTVFKVSNGLGAFVETQTPSGKVGASVVILGSNLTGATSVTFNGLSAAFTVVSSSEITATVPTGATSGAVVVTTPSGKLKSNKTFRIST